MQLTNILVMDLPDGEISTLIAPCRPTSVRMPLSFDQRKHAGAGQRPGSWMAVAFELKDSALLADLASAWDEIIRRHATLRTAIVDEGGELSLMLTECGESSWHPVEAPEDEPTRQTIRGLFDEVCRPLSMPSYRLVVVRPHDPSQRTRVVIGADHSHVDAWSLLVLVRDLTAAMERRHAQGPSVKARDKQGHSRPDDPAPEPLPAPPFAAHTTELSCRPQTPHEVRRRWKEILDAENGIMPTFPLELGDVSSPRNEVIDFREALDSAGLEGLHRWCADAGVRLISAAVLALTVVSLRLSGRPLRAVLPVHSRFEPRWADSVGWFITNSVLESSEPTPQACAEAVTSAIALGSHPLEPIMRPYGGMPERPGMFALSWLDYRRLPVQVPEWSNPQHVSAVVKTDGVMAWFVVTQSGLRVRVRYPDTPEARRNVERWLEAVIAQLRHLASVSG